MREEEEEEEEEEVASYMYIAKLLQTPNRKMFAHGPRVLFLAGQSDVCLEKLVLCLVMCADLFLGILGPKL